MRDTSLLGIFAHPDRPSSSELTQFASEWRAIIRVMRKVRRAARLTDRARSACRLPSPICALAMHSRCHAHLALRTARRGPALPRRPQSVEGTALLAYLLENGSRVNENSLRKGLKKLTVGAGLSGATITMVRALSDDESSH